MKVSVAMCCFRKNDPREAIERIAKGDSYSPFTLVSPPPPFFFAFIKAAAACTCRGHHKLYSIS